jgi:hypothetical protein
MEMRLVSRPGYFTPEETANRYPLTGAVGGFQCRSGRFGEEKTLPSPYENRNTNHFCSSCGLVTGPRGAVWQTLFARLFPAGVLVPCVIHKSVLLDLITRTAHNKPVLHLPSAKCAYSITKISFLQNTSSMACFTTELNFT